MRKEAIQHCGWNPDTRWPRKRLKFEALILDMVVGLSYYEAYAKVENETRGIFHGFRGAALGIIDRVYGFGVHMTQTKHASIVYFETRDGAPVQKRTRTLKGSTNKSSYGSNCFIPLSPIPRHFWRTTKDVRALHAPNCSIMGDQEEYCVGFLKDTTQMQCPIPKTKALKLIQILRHRNHGFHTRLSRKTRKQARLLRRTASALMREKGFRAYMFVYGPPSPQRTI